MREKRETAQWQREDGMLSKPPLCTWLVRPSKMEYYLHTPGLSLCRIHVEEFTLKS